MDDHTFYSYTLQMQRYLENQDKRIAQLEADIQTLLKQIHELQSKPPITVERIEYKFDQLKVETLEGTLSIGLHPNDLSNIEEYAIPSPTRSVPFEFPEKQAFMEEINQAIMKETDHIIKETESEMGASLDPSYYDFIKSDINKQLPQQIESCLHQTSSVEREPHARSQLQQKITEKIKSDLTKAIRQFITTTQNQTGGTI
jgi:spore germination protein PC